MSGSTSPERSPTCGSLLDREEFRRSPKVLFPRFTHARPPEASTGTSFTLGNLPAVTQQGTDTDWGTPGSCEAQSFGYGLGSYTAARNPDGSIKWDASLAGNEASAAWLYRWALHRQNENCPAGSMATPYLAHLVVHGAPTVADVPYQPLCSYLSGISLDKSYPDSPRMRIGAYYTFEITGSAQLPELKALLASGHMIAFSGKVLNHYVSPTNIPDIFQDGIIVNGEPMPKTGHGQLLAGWDDGVGPAGSTGALLVQNSFGTGWPPAACGSVAPAGMAYWSYDTFFASQQFAAVALPLDPTALAAPLLDGNGDAAGSASATQFDFVPTVLVVQVQFDVPLLVGTITLTEPGTGSTMQGKFGAFMNNGYLYFQRFDEQAFVDGDWQVTIDATNTVANEAVVLTAGSLPVPAAGPIALTAAALTADLVVHDTIGDPATITVGS